MACVKRTETEIILRALLFSMSFLSGCEAGQTSICRPVCSEGNCITLNQARVDFKSAEEACQDMNGELLTLDSDPQSRLFDHLREQLQGDFWIGLRLPLGVCSNLSLPLRGYEWLSGRSPGSFIPSSITWNDGVRVCSPSCVSVSVDRRWTERSCSDKAHGYLCRTKHKDACKAQRPSGPYVFQSSRGCSTAPCEHECTDVKGGYICSCHKDFIPDSSNPRLCKQHCGKQKCPTLCDRDNVDACFCPDGYIRNDNVCEDIDECQMDRCDQECNNMFGSYECSCRDGFVLMKDYRCVPPEFPITRDPPAADNTSLKTSSAPAGGFLWIWLFAAGAVVVLICVVRFYVVRRQKTRRQNSSQLSSTATATAAPVENVEC